MVIPIVELRNIKKSYRIGKVTYEVLKGINLRVMEGEFLSIMGPSGGGKSTLLNIIGLLDKPSSGEYLLEGKEVSGLKGSQLAEVRNKKIGFIFQAFHLIPWATALENVLMPLLYSKEGIKKEDISRAKELLSRLGLGDRLSAKPSELSGGQQQRVAIARAIINRPKILLADEPTGNLDSRSSEEVMQIFEELNRDGLTIIMVTHDPEIAKHAQRIKTIKDGVFLE